MSEDHSMHMKSVGIPWMLALSGSALAQIVSAWAGTFCYLAATVYTVLKIWDWIMAKRRARNNFRGPHS